MSLAQKLVGALYQYTGDKLVVKPGEQVSMVARDNQRPISARVITRSQADQLLMELASQSTIDTRQQGETQFYFEADSGTVRVVLKRRGTKLELHIFREEEEVGLSALSSGMTPFPNPSESLVPPSFSRIGSIVRRQPEAARRPSPNPASLGAPNPRPRGIGSEDTLAASGASGSLRPGLGAVAEAAQTLEPQRAPVTKPRPAANPPLKAPGKLATPVKSEVKVKTPPPSLHKPAPPRAPAAPAPAPPKPSSQPVGSEVVDMQEIPKGLFEILDSPEISDLFFGPELTPRVRRNCRLELSELPALDGQTLKRVAKALLGDYERTKLQRHLQVASVGTFEEHRHRYLVTQSIRGTELAVRRLPCEPLDSDDLCIPEILLETSGQTHGLVILSSRTGHGRSTTMAGLLTHLAEREPLNILTLSELPEFHIDSDYSYIQQRILGTHAVDLNAAVSAARHGGVDVLAVDAPVTPKEIHAILNCAEDGMLVLLTMPALSGVHALERLTNSTTREGRASLASRLAQGVVFVSHQVLCRGRSGLPVPAFESFHLNAPLRRFFAEERFSEMRKTLSQMYDPGTATQGDALLDLVKAGLADAQDALVCAEDLDAMKAELARQGFP